MDINTLKLAGNTAWFIFCGDELIIAENTDAVLSPFIYDIESLNIKPSVTQYIGLFGGHKCYVASVDRDLIPAGFTLRGLRQLYGHVSDESFWFAARAFHIISWLRHNKFCGRCGSGMFVSAEELAVQCPQCSHIVYPRISPAVIVAVLKEDKILLVRSSRFPSMYSVIAGYVEPGESLEECVHREIKEEVGIAVTNIKYFGNQPWPFPDSLMVAFTARYAQGTIQIDNKEIIEAGWFSAGGLPAIPPGISIARQLIDWFAGQTLA